MATKIVVRRGSGKHGLPDKEDELRALLAEAREVVFTKPGFHSVNTDIQHVVSNIVGQEFLNAVRNGAVANGGAQFEHGRANVPMYVLEYFIREIERRLRVINAKRGMGKARM